MAQNGYTLETENNDLLKMDSKHNKVFYLAWNVHNSVSVQFQGHLVPFSSGEKWVDFENEKQFESRDLLKKTYQGLMFNIKG